MEPATNLRVIDFEHDNKEPSKKELPSKTYSRADRIKRVQPPNDMAREITKDAAQRIRDRIHAEAQSAADEEKLFMCYVINDFDSVNTLSQDVTIKLSAAHPLGYDRFTQDLLEGKGRSVKFKPEYYGKAFVKSGVEYIITGVDMTNKDNPYVLLRSPDGSMLADCASVYRYMKKQDLL